MDNSNLNDSQTKEIDVSANTRKSVVAGEEIELNINENEKEEKVEVEEKTKKLLNKKIVIGIICILAVILCVIVYGTFISKDSKSNTEDNDTLDESNLLIKEAETYEGLNYTSEKEYIAQIGFFYNYSKNLEGKKIDVSYIKVSGLKDPTLEEKINTKLKTECEKMYDTKNIQDPNVLYDHIYNYTDVYIFNNVLSTMYCEEKSDIDGNVTYLYKSININLKELKEFELKDVFTNTSNISEIIEEENTEDIVFSVSPKNLYIVDENEKVKTINLYKNKDNIAIYKRFNEEKKLFNKTYNATTYAFTTKKFIESDVYGLEEDNLFIDTCNFVINSKYDTKIIEQANLLYKEAVNKARNLSYSNPSKRYLVQIIPQIKQDEEKKYKITVKINTYEIEKQFFNEHIKEFVVASENKVNDEIVEVEYFKNTVMDADKYLNSMDSETLTKEVDESGKEVNLENNSNKNIGIS